MIQSSGLLCIYYTLDCHSSCDYLLGRSDFRLIFARQLRLFLSCFMSSSYCSGVNDMDRRFSGGRRWVPVLFASAIWRLVISYIMKNWPRYTISTMFGEGQSAWNAFSDDICNAAKSLTRELLKRNGKHLLFMRGFGYCQLLVLFYLPVTMYCTPIVKILQHLTINTVGPRKSFIPRCLKNYQYSLFTVHYLRWRMPLSCVSAEACLTGWPNAWVRRGGEVS